MIRSLISFLNWLQDRTDQWTSNSVMYFACVFGAYSTATPVEPARKYQPEWYKRMIEKARSEAQANGKNRAKDQGVVKFNRCPGMHDYFQEGYLIRAHSDIHIKANSVATMVNIPHVGEQELQPQPMSYEIVDGMAPIAPGLAKMVMKVPIPYGIYMEPGHSCHLMPALMHADYLDKIFVYPGTVDYDEFHVCNFIFSAIKECEFIIPAGTPLLHVLPFKRVNYHAKSLPASPVQARALRFGFPSRMVGYYRRMFHKKKIYTSEAKK